MRLVFVATLLLAQSTARAWELPFKLPQVEEIRSRIGSQYENYAERIPSYQSLKSKFELPSFVKNIADPIAASPLLSLHRTLVQVPSISGSEHKVAQVLADYLVSKNFTVEMQAIDPHGSSGRANIFAYLGTNRTASTLVTSHIDTVPPFIPYKASSNTIRGRGTNDAKGSVAAQVIAVEELVADGTLHEGDVSLLYVVGEEMHGEGMKAANGLGLSWNTVIFGEPTENKLAIGHKGISLFRATARGKAAHSGYPQLGINANSLLIKALAIIDNLKIPGSDLLGNTTINIGRIAGGVAGNVIPAHAQADIAVRIAGDYEETLRIIKESIAHLPVELEFSPNGYGPVELDHDIEGFETVICNYGTDVPNLVGDHKKYLYGPGSILVAHGENEYVLKTDLYEAVTGFKTLIKESLWPTKRVPAIVENLVVEETPALLAVSKEAVVLDKVTGSERVVAAEQLVSVEEVESGEL